ncbi:insulinase family protein [Porticoccus sp. W117]|uniref:insulinase family protein n=1 Tax=Porticoccus sp. W117 TaxID=3054777 RepID=UPI00259932EB|nr:insulinase family protein [Porticoccus sp. W117]MDM3871782.1 insulinase family protein [Porticoccus sp. W117]
MKVLVGLFGVLLVLTGCKETEQTSVGQETVDVNMVQSFPLDSKEYRYIELDNGIRTLLVSDDKAVKSLASLVVNIGSYQDPEGWDGLAHFLEHMLFLGTEKYPESAEYNEYLDSNGGNHNAYTAYDITNYHFSVDNSAYEGALDRFAQFFISPLFTEEYVDREKNAVHSEYYTRIEKDPIRNIEVFENTINPAHQAFKFNAGNLDTLSDKPNRSARDELIDFYKTYYSSDLMTLAMVSNQSLDEMEQLARAKFSAVPKLDKVPETVFPELFTEGELPKVIEIKPVQDSRTLVLTFPIADQTEHALENPVGYVAAMLGSKSENNLSDRLKAKGWIQAFGASKGLEYGTTDTFVIRVFLTEKGVSHQDEIIAALFDQIALVKKEGVTEWRYNEMKNLSEMGFRFSENSSMSMQGAINFANALQDTAPRDLIRASYQRFDAALINNILGSLTPDNMVVTFAAPSVVPEQETEFYGADYRTYQPSEDRVKSWSVSQYSDLTLAERNPLIPENLDLVDVKTAEQPVKLVDTNGVDAWYYPNIEDSIPKATVQLAIDRPERPTLEEDLLSQIYFGLMGEQLEKLKFNAENAGVGYSVGAGGVSFSGFSDKLPELADQVLAQVLKPTFTQGQFDRMMENVKRYFANYDKAEPSRGVGRDLDELLDADSYSVEEVRAVAQQITLEKVLAAPQWLFGEGRMTLMASGNITEQQTRDFAKQISETLGLEVTDKAIPKGQRIVELAVTAKPDVYISKLAHADAAVLRYYQGRESTREERLKLHLLSQIMHQQYFNSLRTEQQLGYIVGASAKRSDRTPGITFVVQSPTASAAEVEAATDKFLPEFQKRLNAMDDEALMSLKQATLAQLQQPPQNVGEKVSRFWQDLRDDYPNFDSRQKAIDALKSITMKDIQDAYSEIVMDNPHAVSVISPGAKGGVKANVESAKAFREGKGVITRS